MQKTFTIRDIATRAGVSLGTVSRVMNNAINVDPELRERTLSVMREFHYVPLRRPRKNSRRNLGRGWDVSPSCFSICSSIGRTPSRPAPVRREFQKSAGFTVSDRTFSHCSIAAMKNYSGIFPNLMEFWSSTISATVTNDSAGLGNWRKRCRWSGSASTGSTVAFRTWFSTTMPPEHLPRRN